MRKSGCEKTRVKCPKQIIDTSGFTLEAAILAVVFNLRKQTAFARAVWKG